MQVRFYATLRALVGARTLEVPLPEGASVLDLARTLARLHPALAEHFFADPERPDALARSVHFRLDGRDVRWLPEAEHTVLRPEHEVDVFPPVAGG